MLEIIISQKWVQFVTFILFWHIAFTISAEKAPCVSLNGDKTCYSKQSDPSRLYSSKTKYSVVTEDYTKTLNLTGCMPKALYFFSRHAARFPKAKYLGDFNKELPKIKEKIMENAKKGKVNMCQEDIDFLGNTTLSFDPNNVAQLAIPGAFEARELGQRMRQRFPTLLGLPYSPDVYTIEYTVANRTRQTAEDFCTGVFPPDQYIKIGFNEDKINNEVLQFYKKCDQLISECKKSSFDTSEYKKFQKSPLQKQVYKSIHDRTGVKVHKHEEKRMYRACAFGYAMLKNDAWCSVFSPDEMTSLNYRADLKQYYRDGYGNEQVNRRAPCPVINYIVQQFKNVVNTGKTKVTLHFSHSGAIKKLYTTFGLYKDPEPLTVDNMCEQADRKWNTSYICPFTTNLALILYECNDDYKVVTLHNERPVIIAGCDGYECPLKKFLDYYEPIGSNCDLNKICDTCIKD